MYQPLEAPATIGRILDNGFDLLKASVGQAMLLVLVIAGVGNGLALALESLNPDNPVLVLIGVVLSLIASSWMFAAVITQMNGVSQGQTVSLQEAISGSVSAVPALLGCSILYALIVTLGFFLLIVPGVILSLSLWFAFYIVCERRLGMIASLRESHRLVWGFWWRTAAVVAVIVFIIMVVYVLAVTVVAVLASTGDTEFLLSYWVQFGLNVGLSVLVMPVTVALSLTTWRDLQMRREGADLEDRIQALDAE